MNDIILSLKKLDIKQELNNHQIAHIWLTGSYAKGTATKISDVDLLVQIDKKLPRKAWGIFGAKAFLEEKIGKVFDLIPNKSIDKRIKADLLSHKIQIW